LVSRYETAISSINSLENAVQDREDSLVKLEHVNKSAKESAVKLNKILNDTKVKFQHEKEFLQKEHKLEVKAWRKDLGQAIKNHKKLEKKFYALNSDNEVSINCSSKITSKENRNTTIDSVEIKQNQSETSVGETLCSICASCIPEYTPKYFMGEIMNTACNYCDDTAPDDPFSSFPTFGQPPSLASHWIPNTQVHGKKSFETSMVAHNVIKHNNNKPETKYLDVDSMKDLLKKVIDEYKATIDEQVQRIEKIGKVT